MAQIKIPRQIVSIPSFLVLVVGVLLIVTHVVQSQTFRPPSASLTTGDITTTHIKDGTIVGADFNQGTSASTTNFGVLNLTATGTIGTSQLTGGTATFGSLTATSTFVLTGTGNIASTTIYRSVVGTLHSTSTMTVKDLTINGTCQGCGEPRALWYSEKFDGGLTANIPGHRLTKTDTASECTIASGIMTCVNNNAADPRIMASSSFAYPFRITVDGDYDFGAGEADLQIMALSTGGDCATDGYGVHWSQNAASGWDIVDNGVTVVETSTGKPDRANHLIYEVDYFAGGAVTARWYAATSSRANAVELSTGPRTVSAAGGFFGLCFNSPDANSFTIKVDNLEIGGINRP